MNPEELLDVKFEKKMGGYKAADVDSFMVEAASFFSQQTREIADLKRKLDTANRKLAENEKDKDNLRDALLNAQRLADTIVRDARAKAEKMEQDASVKANSLVAEMRGEIFSEQQKLSEMKRRVSDFRSQLINMYRAHLELINDMPAFHGEEAEEPEEPQSDLPLKKVEEPAAEAVTTLAIEEASATSVSVPAVSEKSPVDADAAEKKKEDTPEIQPEDDNEGTESEDTVSTGDEAVAAEQDGSHAETPFDVKLNVQFDETTGEYIPINSGNNKRRDSFDGKRR